VPFPVTPLLPGDVTVVPAELAGHRDDFVLPLGWRDVRAAAGQPER
jgi:hypothetical protein